MSEIPSCINANILGKGLPCLNDLTQPPQVSLALLPIKRNTKCLHHTRDKGLLFNPHKFQGMYLCQQQYISHGGKTFHKVRISSESKKGESWKKKKKKISSPTFRMVVKEGLIGASCKFARYVGVIKKRSAQIAVSPKKNNNFSRYLAEATTKTFLFKTQLLRLETPDSKMGHKGYDFRETIILFLSCRLNCVSLI